MLLEYYLLIYQSQQSIQGFEIAPRWCLFQAEYYQAEHTQQCSSAVYTYGGIETTVHYTQVGSSEQTQFFEHEADTLQQMRDSIKPNCTPMGNSLDGLHVALESFFDLRLVTRSTPVHINNNNNNSRSKYVFPPLLSRYLVLSSNHQLPINDLMCRHFFLISRRI